MLNILTALDYLYIQLQSGFIPNCGVNLLKSTSVFI